MIQNRRPYIQRVLRAGVSIADISPGPGIELAGYPHHPRHNRGIHDPLFAACLCLDDGSTRLAIVSMDIVMYSKKYVNSVRDKAARRTNIPAKNIMICCSHTHSGPWASGRLDMEALEQGLKPDSDYVSDLGKTLVSLISEAYGNIFEARIGVEKGFCGREQGVGGNRRDPYGIADPEVWTIGVQDREGNWKACLVKYTLHPTFLHSESFLVSADYPGYIRKYLASTKPGMIFMFAQGPSGNQSPRYFRSGKTFAEAERVGTAIGVEADRVLDDMELFTDLPLQVKSIEIDVDIKKLPDKKSAETAVERTKRVWKQVKTAGAPERDVWNAELNFLGAEDTLAYVLLHERGKVLELLRDETPVEIQIIGIGDSRVVGLQGEIFVEFGMTIQYRAPFIKTFVVELANGCLPGYAATAKAHAEGGYETGTSLLTARTGEWFVEAALKLLYQTL
jgi:hypothetical protein